MPDYDFSGPVEAQYGPDDRSYAFATGTEEAYWGCITGVVLRSKEGETLYHKEEEFDPLEMEYTVYVEDFKWMELENEAYLAVFYSRYDERRRLKTTHIKYDQFPIRFFHALRLPPFPGRETVNPIYTLRRRLCMRV